MKDNKDDFARWVYRETGRILADTFDRVRAFDNELNAAKTTTPAMKFLCWLFGHKWSPWKEREPSVFVWGDEGRNCFRCYKHQSRLTRLNSAFAVGQTIKIRIPERYVVANPKEG